MILYENPLSRVDDAADWVAEGPVTMRRGDFGGIVLSSSVDEAVAGDRAHWTLWCPEEFTDGIRIEWEFRPIAEPGLAMAFFAARGHSGDLFGPRQLPRDGFYPQYHSGDIDALHVSYFRHKWQSERVFRTCNLRKSAGFRLVAKGADPLPPADEAVDFYRMRIDTGAGHVRFSINGLPLLDWADDGSAGAPLGGGHVGFRQMAPLVAEYRSLRVTTLDNDIVREEQE